MANVHLQFGETALLIAILYGSSTVLEVLFRAKPNVNVATYTEVHICAYTFMHTHTYIVESLYSMSNLNTNALLPIISQGDTALILACLEDNSLDVHYLLKLGADPNICNKVCHCTLFTLFVLNLLHASCDVYHN